MKLAAARRRKNFRPLACVVLTAAIVVCGIGVRTLLAALDGPRPSDRQVTLAVASLLRAEHLSRRALNDEISERCLNKYIDSLDPLKLYFYKSDIESFAKRKKELDDRVLRGDVAFAYDVYKIYLKRLEERLTAINELLKQEHDFTVDEEWSTDFDNLDFPADAAEARERWRKRLKYDLLVLKAGEIDEKEARDRLSRRYSTFVRMRRQADSDDLLETFLTALTTSFDPHTSYMSPSTLENFEISMRLQLEGIGAALQLIDGYTIVSKIIGGGAAYKHGKLDKKDRVIGVGQGKEGEIVDVVGMRLTDVVKLIRGPRGTVVRLQVQPDDGKGEPRVYAITRERIRLKDQEAQAKIFDDGTKADGTPFRIGVISLPSFYMDMEAARLGQRDFKSTTRDVRRLLKEFNQKKVDAVMVDLRDNGGGSLREAIDLTGLFIDQGPVVQVKGADGRVEHYDDRDAGVTWDKPVVVLINKFSASASEIFAGAIQDYGRGLIVGDRATHGKGTVQSLTNLGRRLFRIPNAPKLGALKITMQQFYRPNGDSTQNRGVLSDIELPALSTHYDIGESDLDFAVAFDRVKPVEYTAVHQVTQPTVDKLIGRSKARQRESKDFQRVLKRIARYKEQKAKKRVTLNEKKFLAERSELEEEKKDLEDKVAEEGNTIERNYYLDEALDITVDYIRLLKGEKLDRIVVKGTAKK